MEGVHSVQGGDEGGQQVKREHPHPVSLRGSDLVCAVNPEGHQAQGRGGGGGGARREGDKGTQVQEVEGQGEDLLHQGLGRRVRGGRGVFDLGPLLVPPLGVLLVLQVRDDPAEALVQVLHRAAIHSGHGRRVRVHACHQMVDWFYT